MDNEDYYEQELRTERRARRIVTELLLHNFALELHEHRDQMNETDAHHNAEKEKMADHIDDLRRYIKELVEQVVSKGEVVDTSNEPRLDISEMRPTRIVAYR
jgi:hypothetical protein